MVAAVSGPFILYRLYHPSFLLQARCLYLLPQRVLQMRTGGDELPQGGKLFIFFSCGMPEVRSQPVFGAAYVAASAGRMLLGEAKAWRPYQVVWLMAKGGGGKSGGGGGKSGPDHTNSRQRISECKRVESCVAASPPSGGHAYPLLIFKEGYDPKWFYTNSGQRVSECRRVELCVAAAPPSGGRAYPLLIFKEGYDPKWSKKHLTGQAIGLPRFDLYRGIDNATGTLWGRDERLRSRPGFLTGCRCRSCCHLALIPPPAPPEAPPPANKEETRYIDGIPELR